MSLHAARVVSNNVGRASDWSGLLYRLILIRMWTNSCSRCACHDSSALATAFMILHSNNLAASSRTDDKLWIDIPLEMAATR